MHHPRGLFGLIIVLVLQRGGGNAAGGGVPGDLQITKGSLPVNDAKELCRRHTSSV